LLVGTVAVMYVRCARARDAQAAYARSCAAYLAASSVLFIVAAAASPVREVIWAIAIAASAGALRGVGTRSTDAPAVDEHHLLERMGAFTIIVCGEAFVKVAIAV